MFRFKIRVLGAIWILGEFKKTTFYLKYISGVKVRSKLKLVSY